MRSATATVSTFRPHALMRKALLVLGFAALPLALAWGQRSPVAITPLPDSKISAPGELSNWTFRQLGIDYPITLRGTDGSVGIPFSVRTDRIVTQATLHLNYSYSPALLADISHIKISVNDVVVATIPVPREKAGKPASTDITIDPRLITDYNRLNLQLIGHYTRDCEDPDNSTLWANVDGGSTLSLTSTALPLANNLSSLPLPFFDRRDIQPLQLPFVFAGTPDSGELEAAGIVASWFGALTGYRGAHFSTSLDGVPEQSNAVVFATPASVPAGVTLPAIDGPMVAEANHPRNPNYKLLLILGRNDEELRSAASALAMGAPLDGAQTAIGSFKPVSPRRPYDAPNWIASDHPVRFDALAQPNTLTVNGYHPDRVRINLQLPPDLFGAQGKGIPLDLRYRYTPPLAPDKSMLSIAVNDYFLDSLPLYAAPDSQSILANWLPRLGVDGALASEKRLHLPVDRFSANSQLRFNFYFQRPANKACQMSMGDQDVHGSIDPSSSIDLTGIPHYIAMPDLAAFANAGFPFSRMADLSQTAIVLPDNPGAADIGNLLNVLGHMGAATGYPTLGAQVISAANVGRFADDDLILLGSGTNQPLLQRWAQQLPVGDGASRRYALTDWLLRTLPDAFDKSVRTDLPTTAEASVRPGNDDVLLMGFESPLMPGRSVVALQANDPHQVDALFKAWEEPATLKQIQGSVALIHGGQVKSLIGNQQYYVGYLPLWLKIRWIMGKHPIVLAIIATLWALLMAWLAQIVLRRRAARRLGNAQ